jgi:hypothetical protein
VQKTPIKSKEVKDHGQFKKEAYFNEKGRWPIVREENGRGTIEQGYSNREIS